MFDRHAIEKLGSGGLPLEKGFEATPYKSFGKRPFGRVECSVHHRSTCKEKLISQPSYTDVSFLLLHSYTPMLEAKHLMPVGRRKDKAYPRYLTFVAWSAIRKKSALFPKRVATYTLYLHRAS